MILTTGLTLWSLATMLCGLAQQLWQLFAARALVGAAESVKGPCSMSMIADLVPHDKLPRAFAIFQLGITGGMAGALVLGGLLLSAFAGMPPLSLPGGLVVRDWHMVLLVTGLPGLLLALVMLLTVKEPARRDRKSQGSVPLRDVLRFLGLNWKFYAPLFLSIAIASVESYGLQAWRPAFFERTLWVGSGTRRPAARGRASDRHAARPLSRHAAGGISHQPAAEGCAAGGVPALLWPRDAVAGAMPLMPDPWLALLLGFLGFTAWSMTAPGQNAAIQIVTPNEMRGQISALYLFSISVVGGGFGPTAIALITDKVFHDEAMLRYALSGFTMMVGPVVLLLIFCAVKPYARAYQRMQTGGSR